MTFKAKLSKQGNSYCIYVPKDVRTELDINTEYEWEVRTKEDKEEVKPIPVRTNKKLEFDIKRGIWV